MEALLHTFHGELGLSGEPPPIDDGDLIARIVAAYQVAHARFAGSGDDALWTDIGDRSRELHDDLMAGDLERVTHALRHPHTTELFHGFDILTKIGHAHFRPGTAQADELRSHLHILVARLVRAVGGGRLPYPEAGQDPNAILPISDALAALDDALGMRIDFPNPYPMEVGIVTERGLLGQRTLNAIYQAWRISLLVRSKPRPRVLEIGAGLGRTAYYAHRMGITDYTIIDIPLSNAAQADFLGRTLGSQHVTLIQEAPRPGAVRILGPGFIAGTDERFDLVVNVDSMTEMPSEIAADYAGFIRAHADAFLSINHEYNHPLVRIAFPGVHFARHPYWMRDGYVEEFAEMMDPLDRLYTSRRAAFRHWLRLLRSKR